MDNYALVARPAAYSWEAMTTLLATEQETAGIQVIFPRPVIILAAYPSLAIHSGDDALPFPELDDLLVKLEVETGIERRLTTRYDTQQSNGIGSLPNVTLGSYRDSHGGSRVMMYDLGVAGSRPELTVTFTWKRAVSGGPYFQNVFVGLLFHCVFKE